MRLRLRRPISKIEMINKSSLIAYFHLIGPNMFQDFMKKMAYAPIITRSDVDAPTETLYAFIVALKMFPPIPPSMIKPRNLYHFPNAFSIENTSMYSKIRFQKRCRKPEWRIIGSKSL